MDLESLVNWESPRFPGSRSSYDECGIILYTKTGLSAHASKEDAREQGALSGSETGENLPATPE